MIQNKGTQTLTTQRLTLRRITPEDGAMMHLWMGDPEVCKYERWTPHPSSEYSTGYIHAVFDYTQDTTYQWGIVFEDVLVGSVSVVNVDEYDQKATLGYSLRKTLWGKGIMTEAVNAVLAYMFIQVGINRIEASHSVNNIGSGRVMQKAGMRLEGYAKQYYNSNAGFQDSHLYGLTREDYIQNHTSAHS